MYFFELEFQNKKYSSERLDVVHHDDEYLLFSLNRSLPKNVNIVSCNTCKFGNFSPYGGNGIYCFKVIDVEKFTDKLDVLDNFTDKVINSCHSFNHYCKDYKTQSSTYMYNSYHYYSIRNPQDKPYGFDNKNHDNYYEGKRKQYKNFFDKLNIEYAANHIEGIPGFDIYLKLKFSGASIEAKRFMEKMIVEFSKNNIANNFRYVNSICSACDKFYFPEIWVDVFSVPLCNFIFKTLEPYTEKENVEFLILKWIAQYSLIYHNDKNLKLKYIEKALIACDYKDNDLLASKSYIK